jgi:hypothetical protein
MAEGMWNAPWQDAPETSSCSGSIAAPRNATRRVTRSALRTPFAPNLSGGRCRQDRLAVKSDGSLHPEDAGGVVSFSILSS